MSSIESIETIFHSRKQPWSLISVNIQSLNYEEEEKKGGKSPMKKCIKPMVPDSRKQHNG